jgi:PhnB protein
MPTRLNPYLSFRDNAREAMQFYRSVFGGTLQQMTFKEMNLSHDPGDDNKIMHSMLETENGIVFMAADTPTGMDLAQGSQISMSLSGDNEEELTGYFERLADGGTVTMPLDQAPWGDKFGMLTDRFGINWMVNIAGQPS